MKYHISEDRRTLTLTCDEETRAALRELSNESFTSQDETEQLERLISNSELQWLSPEDTGDLTDAPLLGILGAEVGEKEFHEEPSHYGRVLTAVDSRGLVYTPILGRWGYPHYALRSFLEDLRDTGKAVFINHW